MVIREYPPDIKRLLKICEPYELKISMGDTTDVPKEAIDAFEKTKKWFWEQDQ